MPAALLDDGWETPPRAVLTLARIEWTAIMTNNEIKVHYASPGLYERIVQGLEAIGKSPTSVDLDDLAAVDEFHFRGPAARQAGTVPH